MSPRRQGFSLIEVIVALAMLALIAIPAVGLATMVVGQSKEQMNVGLASEIRNRVDMALRAEGSSAVFDVDLLPATVWGSQNLQYIELEGEDPLSDPNDQYYRVVLGEPEGYDYIASDNYRIILFELTWPHNVGDQELNQVFFTTVFRK